MRNTLRKLSGAWALVFAVAALAWAQTQPPAELVSELGKGGYVIFIRHAQTNPDQADTDPLHLDNVQAQRQLSDAGRAQASALGRTFKTLRIPVEKVVASQFNRAQETATLLGVGTVSPTADVTEGGLVVSPKENQRRAKALKQLLGTPPASGKNLVVVSHKPNLLDAAGKDFVDSSEGEVFVFQPLGGEQFKLFGRYSADTWSGWSGK